MSKIKKENIEFTTGDKTNLILSLDTSGAFLGLHLTSKNTTLAKIEIVKENLHDKYLAYLTATLLELCGLKAKDLSAIAVVSGPGSFTGLRIGVAFAKGLTFEFNNIQQSDNRQVKLISVSTMSVMLVTFLQSGHYIGEGRKQIRVLLKSHKNVFYSQSFEVKNTSFSALQEVELIEFNEVTEFIEDFIIGYSEDFSDEILKNELIRNKKIIKLEHSINSVSTVAWERFNSQEFENPSQFIPQYSQEFVIKK